MIASSVLESWRLGQVEVLGRFRWQEPRYDGRKFVIDALGGRVATEFYTGVLQDEAFPLRFRPGLNDILFEWTEVLGAVLAARERFTMVELGSGWARWLVIAAYALRQLSDMPVTLIGVEAEPTHFRWSKSHVRRNGLDGASAKIIHAALGLSNGRTSFYTGSPGTWYGQAVADGLEPTPWRLRIARKLLRQPSRVMDTVEEVPMITLHEVIKDLERIDMMHVDIQGAELATLSMAAREVDAKVARIVIGTHSESVEAGLRELFEGLGWEKVCDYTLGSWNDTPYGRLEFPKDGLEAWHNPRLSV